ncbi:hypothetical protein Naga_103105g1 [Nannochloropsis gaditana]|uniref:Uncharacterized protein n=1 Tax=Nannochloropsis gaditana TaxID=72520 RepID=W7TI08_9STRA|nr:hypothetical protein Naga_103105g1 [Nannochloropsis gaditana]
MCQCIRPNRIRGHSLVPGARDYAGLHRIYKGDRRLGSRSDASSPSSSNVSPSFRGATTSTSCVSFAAR